MISTVKGSAFGNALIKQADANLALQHLGLHNVATVTLNSTNGFNLYRPSNGTVLNFPSWGSGGTLASPNFYRINAPNANLDFLNRFAETAAAWIRFNVTDDAAAVQTVTIDRNGRGLFGVPVDNGSGRIQLATHSTAANGFGLGSGLSLYSSSSTVATLSGDFTAQTGNFSSVISTTGVRVSAPSAFYVGAVSDGSTFVVKSRRTGWALATGTKTRTTFDSGTVTLAQLAERVAALIDDLHATAGHGLIGT